MRNLGSQSSAIAERQVMFRQSKSSGLNLLLTILLCVSALMAGAVLLQGQQPAPSSGQEAHGYPVTVEGHEVFEIYEAFGPIPAHDRAETVSERLEKLVFTPGADLAAITTNDSEYGTDIRVGDNVLTIVSDEDAKRLHVPRAALAKYYANQIRNAVTQARHEHSAKFLVRAAIYAVVTFLVYVLAVGLVVIGARWFVKRLQRPGAPLFKGFKIQESEILAGQRFAVILVGLVRLLRGVIIFILTLVFLGTEFKFFPWTRLHGRQLLDYILIPLRFVGTAVLDYLPKLVYILIILAVMYYVMKFVRILAREFERGTIRIRGFYPEWIKPTYNIVRFLLIAFTAVVIYPYLPGENSPAFKGVGIFLGVLLSLGSSSAVANAVAGIILTYTRGFRVGDWVKIGDNIGDVISQNMLATHLRTFQGEEIVIPNSVVLGSHVINYSLLGQTEGVILHTSVTIGYDTPWRTVHGLLLEAAGKTRDILAEPAPFVLQRQLEDSYVQYEINAYTRNPHAMFITYSNLHANIQDCFYAAGVEIMSPVYHSLRDGNKTAIPAEFLPPDYRPHGFRITKVDDGAAAAAGKDK
ncbi:MAG: mechanosensitive ion channel family protein [Candidatus Korobacteraceae bacterium]|jgi:small-conductance mechanosensitive channel